MGSAYTVLHAADLAANLPAESRCMCAAEPVLDWDKKDYLLAEAVNMLRIMVWAQSKDGQKGRNRPKMVEAPKSRAQIRAKKKKGQMSADDYRAQLVRARK